MLITILIIQYTLDQKQSWKTFFRNRCQTRISFPIISNTQWSLSFQLERIITIKTLIYSKSKCRIICNRLLSTSARVQFLLFNRLNIYLFLCIVLDVVIGLLSDTYWHLIFIFILGSNLSNGLASIDSIWVVYHSHIMPLFNLNAFIFLTYPVHIHVFKHKSFDGIKLMGINIGAQDRHNICTINIVPRKFVLMKLLYIY